MCYFCPRRSVEHPPQIILMHYLLGIALMRALRVSVGAAPLTGYLGDTGALWPLPWLPGEPVGTSMKPVEREPRYAVSAGPDALPVPVSCSPWVALGPAVCPVMHRRHRRSSPLAASPRRYRPISSRSGGVLSFRKDGGNGKGSTSSLGKYSSSEFISWRAE